MKEEFIDLEVGGTPLHIATMTRQGQRAAIVFLHGFGSTKEDFVDIGRFPQFDDRPVIAFDAPGCGVSECANLSAISIPFLRDTEELGEILDSEINPIETVAGTRTTIVLQTIKEDVALGGVALLNTP